MFGFASLGLVPAPTPVPWGGKHGIANIKVSDMLTLKTCSFLISPLCMTATHQILLKSATISIFTKVTLTGQYYEAPWISPCAIPKLTIRCICSPSTTAFWDHGKILVPCESKGWVAFGSHPFHLWHALRANPHDHKALQSYLENMPLWFVAPNKYQEWT